MAGLFGPASVFAQKGGAFPLTHYRLKNGLNVVLSERRERRRREARITLADDLEPFAGPVPAARPGAALDLERAIASLPRQARHVFVLHDVQGWEHAEIAHQTGLAVGTCKAHLHRARRLLREVLSS